MISVYEQIKIIILYILLGIFLGLMYSTINFFVSSLKRYLRYIIELISYLVLIIVSTFYIIKNTDYYLGIYCIIFITFGVLLFYTLIFKNYSHTLNNFKNYLHKNKYLLNKLFRFFKTFLFPIELFKYVIYKFKIFYLKIIKLLKNRHKKKQTNN